MNKAELIAAVAEETGMTKTQTEQVTNALFTTITNALSKGEEVKFLGFGNFKVTERKATTGRNPRTGEAIQIAASKQAKFVAGKALKDAVNSDK